MAVKRVIGCANGCRLLPLRAVDGVAERFEEKRKKMLGVFEVVTRVVKLLLAIGIGAFFIYRALQSPDAGVMACAMCAMLAMLVLLTAVVTMGSQPD